MPSQSDATLTALGVGHGDALLLKWRDGTQQWTCLVDGGEKPGQLMKCLSRNGVDRIDLLVLSHFDNDHIGGLVGLARSVEIREYWGPATPAYHRHLWIFGDRCRQAIERAQGL